MGTRRSFVLCFLALLLWACNPQDQPGTGVDGVHQFAPAPREPGPWVRTYGGDRRDILTDVAPADDGGFFLFGGKWSGSMGWYDFWLMRVDSTGGMLWEETYGGEGQDRPARMVKVADGLVLAGGTASKGAGNLDLWLAKVDFGGGLLWETLIGEAGREMPDGVVETADGGFLIGGSTDSFGAEGERAWVVRTDSDGALLWHRVYHDHLSVENLRVLPDGGFLAVGFTGPDPSAADYWLMGANPVGEVQWERTYGGPGHNGWPEDVELLPDGGFVVVGWMCWDCPTSEPNRFRTGYDAWVLRCGELGDTLWTWSLGTALSDHANSVLLLADGGFLLGGTTDWPNQPSTPWVKRLDADGREVGMLTFPGRVPEDAVGSLRWLPDGRVAAVGPGWVYGISHDAQGWLGVFDPSQAPFPKPLVRGLRPGR